MNDERLFGSSTFLLKLDQPPALSNSVFLTTNTARRSYRSVQTAKRVLVHACDTQPLFHFDSSTTESENFKMTTNAVTNNGTMLFLLYSSIICCDGRRWVAFGACRSSPRCTARISKSRLVRRPSGAALFVLACSTEFVGRMTPVWGLRRTRWACDGATVEFMAVIALLSNALERLCLLTPHARPRLQLTRRQSHCSTRTRIALSCTCPALPAVEWDHRTLPSLALTVPVVPTRFALFQVSDQVQSDLGDVQEGGGVLLDRRGG